jgi:hypothetical protein
MPKRVGLTGPSWYSVCSFESVRLLNTNVELIDFNKE